ncbi:MAG: 2-oxo-4-hydroxy-4-carboxy-5-ureidoimidazoline decarboxylase [Roseiflexaceae bacterium]
MTTQPRLLPIQELNALDQAGFAAALKPLFETAPPLAEGLYAARPFASYAALLVRAEQVIAGLDEDQKIAVINAHPRIGENAAAVRQHSALSYREQGYAAEAGQDQEELARVYRELAELNAVYEGHFGFRFVVFVNRRPKAAILEVLRQRLDNPRPDEMQTALEAMLAIARDRLATLESAA